MASMASHGLRSGAPQTAYARRPSLRSTRRACRKVTSGVGISMIPKRHITASTLRSGRSLRCASIVRNSTFPSPRAAAPRRAASTMADPRSVEINLPAAPIRSAARKPVSPGPAASSSTVCPGCGSIRSTSHSETPRCDSKTCSRYRSQAGETASDQRSSSLAIRDHLTRIGLNNMTLGRSTFRRLESPAAPRGARTRDRLRRRGRTDAMSSGALGGCVSARRASSRSRRRRGPHGATRRLPR